MKGSTSKLTHKSGEETGEGGINLEMGGEIERLKQHSPLTRALQLRPSDFFFSSGYMFLDSFWPPKSVLNATDTGKSFWGRREKNVKRNIYFLEFEVGADSRGGGAVASLPWDSIFFKFLS